MFWGFYFATARFLDLTNFRHQREILFQKYVFQQHKDLFRFESLPYISLSYFVHSYLPAKLDLRTDVGGEQGTTTPSALL